MPEGPSILILKEKLQPFTGQKVIAASCNNGTLDARILTGQTITAFKSWGKHFLICFAGFTIRIHMMMFGTYRINSRTEKSPRLHLQFEDGELNFYACQLKLIEEPLDEVYDWQADVMSEAWDTKKAIKKMKAIPGLLACDALMDQQIFSGVGNIIKNEALFRSRIHPESVIAAMPPKKVKELITETILYSFEFLEQRKEGTLKRHWQAYHKKECPRNHVPFISKDTGRSRRASFYCELCQVKYQ
ncbi:DNA-formamidopyrimidine glycosylase family protein [Mucilaginibacter sp. AK015]|uniref:DNA-formamidopyrimidine glycosylase family protein n=1 Tax=Mucilaginibacter sp. AK015 TaxID=2723072 RepID=UPI0016228514|nr:DNA-formamidopyrimidine glycosylase family protein [Mucilaginibacter sp. AK015]MBB5395458.1 endonuclease-8 [Mucilaginibacter sp. AK015]